MSKSIFGRFKKSEEPDIDVEELEFNKQSDVFDDRAFWVDTLEKIAFPVLNNLKKGNLKKNMPFESSSDEMKKFSHLGAFSRVFNGISPWLNLKVDATPEGRLREKFVGLTLTSIENAVNPNSDDYLNFSEPKYSLASSAIFAQGLLRSKHQIWSNLPIEVQAKIITNFKNTRIIAPYDNHWLLYTSMIEAALLEFTGECDLERLNYGILKFWDEWYLGDGIYNDGNKFKVGYENSTIIHPLLNDILMVMRKYNEKGKEFLNKQLMRTSRLASQLERIISPTGSYPLIGESLTYRTGIFHALSQAALIKILPSNITPAQVRCGLTQVLKSQFQENQNFLEGDWLAIGINGHQKEAAEETIETGAIYMCCNVFLPLGLPQNDPFWSSPYEEWSSLKAWNGNQINVDQSIDF